MLKNLPEKNFSFGVGGTGKFFFGFGFIEEWGQEKYTQKHSDRTYLNSEVRSLWF